MLKEGSPEQLQKDSWLHLKLWSSYGHGTFGERCWIPLSRDCAKLLQHEFSACQIILCSTVILVVTTAYIVHAELFSHLEHIEVSFEKKRCRAKRGMDICSAGLDSANTSITRKKKREWIHEHAERLLRVGLVNKWKNCISVVAIIQQVAIRFPCAVLQEPVRL